MIMMDDAIQSFLDDHQPSSASPASYIPATRPPIACCCGNIACAYLQHNESALDGLERDVSTAARLGKVSNTALPSCQLSRLAGGCATQTSSMVVVVRHAACLVHT